MKRLGENLEGTNENHIFPLFWQHGENESVLRGYMEKIEESGIRALCVEARPHTDFMGAKWWGDLDIILDEAKKRNMKVWILDDSHFPTGFANGEIKNRFSQLRKRFLKLYQLDFIGPLDDAEAILKYAFTDKDDKLEGVFLAKKTGYETIDSSTLVDITGNVRDSKTVGFDLPAGEWSVLTLVSTFTGGEKETEDYLNPIDPKATDILIHTIYEPHFRKYKDEFGKTISGFFSDEPRFGNMHGALGSIGRFDMVLPWREDMISLMDQKSGFPSLRYLPLLFIDGGEKSHQMRYLYMDLVSDLYAEHFSKRIGDWCTRHGVEYIGHTIEDNNAHARLGYGAGHFFKAMAGQDMAGIDVVLHQLMPGMDHDYNKAKTQNGWDGEFFHYALAKLGSSLGHLDPRKKGRTMCEVFGAYGWAEGNRLMKWIQDHMLVRGVNEFVPHAFNPGEYPDVDCPPHMYAHGKNPQYQEFKLVMDDTNRMSHLLSGGIHRACAAVSYHAEAEWSGEYMLIQKPAAILCRNQIDYDFLPIAATVDALVVDGKLVVNQESFQALVIPYAQALPAEYLHKLEVFSKAGLDIYFIDQLPERASNGENVEQLIHRLAEQPNVEVIQLMELAGKLKEKHVFEVETSEYQPYLRYYHYEQMDGHIFMFVNEHPYQLISTNVTFPLDQNSYWYDALENKAWPAKKGKLKKLELAPYEAAVLIFPQNELQIVERVTKEETMLCEYPVKGPFKVTFADSGDFSSFKDDIEIPKLVPMQKIKGKEDFAGVIRYEADFCLKYFSDKKYIELSGVAESARVYVNDSACGVKICPPYRFDITEAVKQGVNKLAIEVTTTLVREQYDFLSQYMLVEPIGITKSIVIKQKNFSI